MRQYFSIRTLLLFPLLVCLSSCGGDNGEPSTQDNGKDRKEILTHWADNIIAPSYANFQLKLDALVTAGNAFSEAPSGSTLDNFRSAWIEAYKEWQKVELFELGPADKYALRSFFNIYPADVAGITTNIADPSSSLEVPASYPRQGFPALDYLLNGTGSSNDEILAFYNDATEGTKRLGYVNRITTRMKTLLTTVVNEWNGGYRDTFISKTGLDVGSSFGLVVNAYVLNYERYIRSGKFGIPSGSTIATGGVPYPEKVEAYYKRDISLELAKLAHDASYNFFLGTGAGTGGQPLSMKSYLDALDARDASSGKLLTEIIEDQFLIVSNSLNALLPDLYEQVNTNNAAMISTYSNMQALVRMLKVDMTSAMSITITYTDNDGD